MRHIRVERGGAATYWIVAAAPDAQVLARRRPG
jgi:hypothetical protein